MKFSQRIGQTPVRNLIQFEEIDSFLQIKIWNCFLTYFYLNLDDHHQYSTPSYRAIFCKVIWEHFFNEKVDEIAIDGNGYIMTARVLNYIKTWFFEAEWYEIYDFVEFISYSEKGNDLTVFTDNCNKCLESEMSAYRIINSVVTPIISEVEISSIEEAINNSPLSGVETHLTAALKYLADRVNPDYRNSVKESISAVEAMCGYITGEEKGTLGKTIGKVEKKLKLHQAYKEAFDKLYGFTSDSGGIRHSILEDDIPVTLDDAKFMLIACSAFINFLKTKQV